MITEKLITYVSQEIDVDRKKKFSRRTNHSTHSNQSVSKDKDTPSKIQNQISTMHGNESTMKKMTESFKFEQVQGPLQIRGRRATESHKLGVHKDRLTLQYSQVQQQLQTKFKDSQIQSLRSECRKLKLYLNEQRQKRKLLEQELSLSHIEIKRLQRRVMKYRKQKQILMRQREVMNRHIQSIEDHTLSAQNKTLNSYRLNFMQQEVRRLKTYFQTTRSERQLQLQKQIHQLNEENYILSKQINTNYIESDCLAKQIADLDHQLQQIKLNNHQKAANSADYMELQQRYRILLMSHRQLKQQMRQLINESVRDDSKNNQISFLTVSNDSIVVVQ